MEIVAKKIARMESQAIKVREGSEVEAEAGGGGLHGGVGAGGAPL